MLFLFLRGENRTNGLLRFILQNVHAWLGSTGTGPACHAAGMMEWVVGRHLSKAKKCQVVKFNFHVQQQIR